MAFSLKINKHDNTISQKRFCIARCSRQEHNTIYGQYYALTWLIFGSVNHIFKTLVKFTTLRNIIGNYNTSFSINICLHRYNFMFLGTLVVRLYPSGNR